MTLGRSSGTGGCSEGRKEVADSLSLSGQTAGGGPSGVELVGQRPVEHEVRDGLGVGRIEGRSLIEQEVSQGDRKAGEIGGGLVGQVKPLTEPRSCSSFPD